MVDLRPSSLCVARELSYRVAGSTLDMLLLVIEATGPVRAGRRYAAYTDWRVEWSFGVAEDDGFHVAEPTVAAFARVHLPSWRPPALASRDLMEGWARYLSALRDHEAGHLAVADRTAQDVLESLLALPTARSVRELMAFADEVTRVVIERGRQAERHYDEITAHGRTQGAVLQLG